MRREGPGKLCVDIHLADEAIFIHAFALATLGLLSPHLLDVL